MDLVAVVDCCCSVPLLLVIDEYNAFLGNGKLMEYNEDLQQDILREDVEPKENAVARMFNWNTFRVVSLACAHAIVDRRRILNPCLRFILSSPVSRHGSIRFVFVHVRSSHCHRR